jgi:hypothetical protein
VLFFGLIPVKVIGSSYSTRREKEIPKDWELMTQGGSEVQAATAEDDRFTARTRHKVKLKKLFDILRKYCDRQIRNGQGKRSILSRSSRCICSCELSRDPEWPTHIFGISKLATVPYLGMSYPQCFYTCMQSADPPSTPPYPGIFRLRDRFREVFLSVSIL